MMAAHAPGCLPEEIAAEAGIEVREEDPAGWPLALSAHSFIATIAAGPRQIQGFGCGPTAEDAQRSAIMECLERKAQFGSHPPQVKVANGRSLGDAVLPPDAFGLYAEDQYNAADFSFARYSGEETLEWVEVAEMKSRQRSYVPVEFVYPHAVNGRKPLVGETSSGTAAHSSRTAAVLAALCELIERDSLMMFWHRQPPVSLLSIDPRSSSRAARDLEGIRAMGFVLVLCLLQFDLGTPCVLALALRENRFAYGAGCHPCVDIALEHALRELGSLLRWHLLKGGRPRFRISLAEVKNPEDHYALYDGGPFHSVIRQALENTIRLPPQEYQGRETLSAQDALDRVTTRLYNRGFRAYEFDLTPRAIGRPGLSVVRTLVPGLIPIYFGYDNIRMGCRRLWSREAPGRLCTLLPHFIV